ncbi:MAG TPA: neutral zinc metallopeptidase, partial [Sphingomicrobium sp.]|nr:neutral zinc metallopeptidase [Sphingomicrobium sp.]
MVRLGGEGPSSNFEDRTGQGGGFGFGGGGGSNLLGCLLPMVMSRFGFVGVLILLLGYCALTQLGGGGGIIPSGPTTSAPGGGASKLDPNMRDFLTRGLGSTEETWTEIFAKSGARYAPTRMVAYSGGTQTACGMGQAAMGPFYCPNDNTIYID